MSKYVIVYLGGDQPATSEAQQQHFAKYVAWLQSLGNAAVSPMNPFNRTKTVHADGCVTEGSATTMSGYTIVEAESMDAALSMAKACPFLEINGTLEVSELVEM